MALDITYTWTIDGLICTPVIDGKNNVVKSVRWTATASTGIEENTRKVSMSGERNITYDSTSTFIAYDNLSPDVVLEWVWAVAPLPPATPDYTPRPRANLKIRTEMQLKSQLEKLVQPTEVLYTSLPWAKNS